LLALAIWWPFGDKSANKNIICRKKRKCILHVGKPPSGATDWNQALSTNLPATRADVPAQIAFMPSVNANPVLSPDRKDFEIWTYLIGSVRHLMLLQFAELEIDRF
jgi:hypothetical protein